MFKKRYYDYISDIFKIYHLRVKGAALWMQEVEGVNHQSHQLDKIDRNIVRLLQQDARMPHTELARKVGLSTTPCKERVRRLEREGVIQHYQAVLNPGALDRGLVVFVQISLNRTSQDIFEAFTSAAVDLPEVQECYLVSGNFDYLLKARVADMNAYRILLGETLLTLPGVLDSSSYVVMEQVKESLMLPVPA
jgi:Lrp/AsnC family leucine-responsive transcriptional regulator